MFKFALKCKIDYLNTELDTFINIFHKWIQEDKIPNHTMVDVADYKHIVDGPGIMLIAHEGYFSLDSEDGELGLLYMRKSPLGNDISKNILNIQQILNFAIELLKLEFNSSEKILFSQNYTLISNDRYAFPNSKNGKNELFQIVSDIFSSSILSMPQSTTNGERLKINIE